MEPKTDFRNFCSPTIAFQTIEVMRWIRSDEIPESITVTSRLRGRLSL